MKTSSANRSEENGKVDFLIPFTESQFKKLCLAAQRPLHFVAIRHIGALKRNVVIPVTIDQPGPLGMIIQDNTDGIVSITKVSSTAMDACKGLLPGDILARPARSICPEIRDDKDEKNSMLDATADVGRKEECSDTVGALMCGLNECWDDDIMCLCAEYDHTGTDIDMGDDATFSTGRSGLTISTFATENTGGSGTFRTESTRRTYDSRGTYETYESKGRTYYSRGTKGTYESRGRTYYSRETKGTKGTKGTYGTKEKPEKMSVSDPTTTQQREQINFKDKFGTNPTTGPALEFSNQKAGTSIGHQTAPAALPNAIEFNPQEKTIPWKKAGTSKANDNRHQSTPAAPFNAIEFNPEERAIPWKVYPDRHQL
jgi:hypothetical protein